MRKWRWYAPGPLQPRMQFRAPVLRRILPAFVVVALLFAQALGLLHGIAHAPLARDAAWSANASSSSRAGEPADAAEVFSHEAGEPTCRLFDALTCGSAAASDAASPAAAPVGFERPLALHAPRAAPRNPFQARGPPTLS